MDKNVYYQVNSTYYSALGGKMTGKCCLPARFNFYARKPQVWYLDLFAGRNNHEAVRRAGVGGHKEINRNKSDTQASQEALKKANREGPA
jgi:sucrose phosphorylase